MLCYMFLNGISNLVVHILSLIQIQPSVLTLCFAGLGSMLALIEIGASAMFLRMHLWMLSTNLTSVEVTQNSFRWSRMSHFKVEHCYVHPFSRSSLYFSLQEVFGSNVMLWFLPFPPRVCEERNTQLKYSSGYEILANEIACEELGRLEQKVEDIVTANLKEAGLLK
jgi:hypothetical protein